MVKWKLMLNTLPYVVAAVVAKEMLVRVAGFAGVVDFSDVGFVLTGGVFLIGFMLAGTMADFKESEKIPGELACTLESIEETFAQAAVSKPALDGPGLRRSVLDATTRIHDWLFKRIPQTEMYVALEALTARAQALEKAGATPLGVRAINEVTALRKITTRIAVISRTGFISSGYALLETLTAAIVVLMLIAKFKNPLGEGILVGFVTLVYVYMLRLIRDVDDPFEYATGGPGGAAEVALFPLEEYRERLQARVASASEGAVKLAE